MLSINITGIDNVRYRLEGKIKPDKIKEELIKSGLEIEGTAKDYCPVDTGRLRASISTNWDGSGRRHGETDHHRDGEATDGVSQPVKQSGDLAVVRVGSNVKYAPFVEFGTQRMRPQPYLLPAVYDHFSGIMSRLHDMLRV